MCAGVMGPTGMQRTTLAVAMTTAVSLCPMDRLTGLPLTCSRTPRQLCTALVCSSVSWVRGDHSTSGWGEHLDGVEDLEGGDVEQAEEAPVAAHDHDMAAPVQRSVDAAGGHRGQLPHCAVLIPQDRRALREGDKCWLVHDVWYCE